MSLNALNNLDANELKSLLAKCCGSLNWVARMVARFPFDNEALLLMAAANTWYACSEADWLEAFTHHPKIGDLASLKQKFANTADWAAGEQAAVAATAPQVLADLADANKRYEEKFGYIFIVCATGKSAAEMLQLLRARLNNDPEDEIRIAMEEQNKITAIRLQKLLHS